MEIWKQVRRALHKNLRIGRFYGPFFPAFGLSTERYGVSVRIQSECRKIRGRKTPNTDTFDTAEIKTFLINVLIYFNAFYYSGAITSDLEMERSEAYSKPCQTCKRKLFAKIVNDWKPLTIFGKKLHLRCLKRFWIRPWY